MRTSLAHSELALKPPPPRPPRLHRACLSTSAHVHALPAHPSPSALSTPLALPPARAASLKNNKGSALVLHVLKETPVPPARARKAHPRWGVVKKRGSRLREKNKARRAPRARPPARRPGLPPTLFLWRSFSLEKPPPPARARHPSTHTVTHTNPGACDLSPTQHPSRRLPTLGVPPRSIFFVCAAPPACVRLCLLSRRQPLPPPPWPLPRPPPRPSSPRRRATSWPTGTRTRQTCRR